MNQISAALCRHESEPAANHFDVLIVGAGISGIGAAYHLGRQCPGTSYVVLEAQGGFGGTWRTHRYPGIRSDSDLYTFGYRFKPWTGAPLATAEEIRHYLGEVIEENHLAEHIRYHHTIASANWSSDTKSWTVEATRTDTGAACSFTANFLYMCQGYYRHTDGYTPEWPGMAAFNGRIVHPQTWPDDLDHAAKRVVVIGSGATAATLIPALAKHTAHVTMLQRSPTFFRTGRNAIEIADELRELGIDETWIHEIVRRKIMRDSTIFAQRSLSEPDRVRQELLEAVRGHLGDDAAVEKHFTPSYRPWRQRIAFIPDGDLLTTIRAGRASVVTGEIESFTETRHPARLGTTSRCRHRRDRDRVSSVRAWRHRLRDRREAGRFRQHRDVSRHDVHRGAESRLGVRLFPRCVDAARGPRRRFRLPPAQPHAGTPGAQRLGGAAP